MYKPKAITDNIFYVGVNDRRTHLFENLWPTDRGVSYNAYLIKDEKNALIDTVEIGRINDFFDNIDLVLDQGEKIDYLVINHLEPDHSGAIQNTIRKYPEIKIVGNKKTFTILNEFYGIQDNLYLINEEEKIDLGKHTLSFFMTPMLHWPETMMTFEENSKALFSGDAFGSFGTLDGGIFDDELNLDFYEEEIRRYYSNIVGKYWNPVQKAIKKLNENNIVPALICSTHGPVWRSDINKIVGLYDKWSRFDADPGVVIVYGSMYGNTEKMAEAVGRSLNENGIKDIRIHDASKTHISHIINDIFKYKGVVLGSSAYNGTIFPPMEHVINKISNTGVKNRFLGIIGSATWGGGGVKSIEQFAEKINWEIVADPIQAKGAPKGKDFELCEKIGIAMAEKILENS